MKVLTPLPSDKIKKYITIGFDVETRHKRFEFTKKTSKEIVKAKTNDFYIGGLFYSDDDFKYFFDKEEMINFILSKRHYGKILVATNLGFDFNALFYGTKYWHKFKIIYSGSKLISAVYDVDGKHKISFYDTGNYIPLSVEVMGDILKIPKLNKPSCLGRIPRFTKEEKELLIYNRRDCEISKKFLDLLQDTFNLMGGDLKLTVASTAMNVFRRKYLRFLLKHEKDILNEDDFYDFVFSAYYGGRTEAFSRGFVKNARVYDVNSLYPKAMLNAYPHPHSVRKMFNPVVDDLDFYLKFEGVMNVDIQSPKYMKYPYLPLKYEVKKGVNKLVFPLGRWNGTYTNYELRKAVELGYKILDIKRCYIYKRTFYPFRAYVQDLYSQRLIFKKQNSPLELGVKLLLNSLYGKFGQRYLMDVNFIDLDSMSQDEKENFIFGEIVGTISLSDNRYGIQTIEKECDSSFVFPIFPVYTTAYARTILYDFIVEHNALYCDTDSILTYDTLKESSELGKMKVEYDVLEGVIVKPKMYMYKTPSKVVVRMKGVSRASQDKFIRALEGLQVSYEKFTKIKESVRRNIPPNAIINLNKFIDLQDNKRLWDNSFNASTIEHSKPLIVDLLA